MAVEAIQQFNADKILMTYGSSYHVSNDAEDFEYNIAQRLQARIEGRLFFRVEKLVFDARHKVGQSGTPAGRGTALLRTMAWDLIHAGLGTGPRVNVVVRSHTHYHIWIEQPNRIMFITPALQLSRGRYGSRQCSGETHWGAIRLIIKGDQIIERNIVCKRLTGNAQRIIKIR